MLTFIATIRFNSPESGGGGGGGRSLQLEAVYTVQMREKKTRILPEYFLHYMTKNKVVLPKYYPLFARIWLFDKF